MNVKLPRDLVATFSIVGYDPQIEELGIAVQSKFIGVGAVVPWAKAGVGAVATQSYANTSYGPVGLELMAKQSFFCSCEKGVLNNPLFKNNKLYENIVYFKGIHISEYKSGLVGS